MPTSISRRTLAKGAAWTAPVVAIATAAPRVAASALVTIAQGGDACKLPGNSCAGEGYSKGYLQPLMITNSSQETVTITFPDTITLSLGGTPTTFTPNPQTATIEPGKSKRFILNLNNQGNSKNQSISGTIKWTATGATTSLEGTTEIVSESTPPCSGCTA